jgi:hypothetical protein
MYSIPSETQLSLSLDSFLISASDTSFSMSEVYCLSRELLYDTSCRTSLLTTTDRMGVATRLPPKYAEAGLLYIDTRESCRQPCHVDKMRGDSALRAMLDTPAYTIFVYESGLSIFWRERVATPILSV